MKTDHSIYAPKINRVIDKLPETVFAFGFSHRKHSILRRFLKNKKVVFVNKGKQVPVNSTLLLWGSETAPDNLQGVNIVRIEDGFLRSVGLGADLVKPLSWVIDSQGIYYDATRPSDLEHILQSADYSLELIQRAALLRQRIVKDNVTKYNVGTGKWTRPRLTKRVILVPGQVETDASIRFGAPGIHTNLDLLKAVRQAHPDVYLIYKPHPEITTGLRPEGKNENAASLWCDEIVTDIPMGQLLVEVDDIHVLTSLTGFEALLRNKRVTCYGQPFYAGWGLTTDIMPITRRTNNLGIDALVAGTLILYPIYISNVDQSYSSPEQTLDELLKWKTTYHNSPSLIQKAIRCGLRLITTAKKDDMAFTARAAEVNN